MENIVITGATGFLGSHLAQWFLEQETGSMPWYGRDRLNYSIYRSTGI